MIFDLNFQTVVPENVVETPPPTNDRHDQADECRQPLTPSVPEEPPTSCATDQNPPSPPAQSEPKNGSVEETANSALSDREFSGALPPTPNSNSNSANDVCSEPPPRASPAAPPTTECAVPPPAIDTDAQPKNDEPPRYSESAPATVEDDRSFRKVTSYYGNQGTVPDRSERPNDHVDKYRFDKAREKPVVDSNTKIYNQTNLGGVNNAVAAAFTPFNAVSAPPAPFSTLPPEKAVNLSDCRPYVGLPTTTAQSYANYEMSFQRQFPPDYSEEKYLKNKRLKSTSPVKSSANSRDREFQDRYKNSSSGSNNICEPIRKLHAERDDRYANKEPNVEQKVRKMAQVDEEQQKYKERNRVKSPVAATGAAGSKDRRPNKAPAQATYSVTMDAVNEYAAAKHMEEMKYKRRGDYDEHLMVPVGAANMDLTSQHFAGATHLPKQSLPSPHERSMGVYTPDSTTNSVHSVHGYGHQYDIDSGHLSIESPSSISSNDMNSNLSSNEGMVRPPSGTLSMHEMYMNSTQQATMFALQQLQQTHSMHTLPQLQAAAAAAVAAQSASSHSKSQNSRKNSSGVNHHGHHHHRTKSASAHHQPSGGGPSLNSASANSALHRSTPTAVGNPHSPVGAYNSGSPNSATNNSSTSPMGGHHRSTPPAVNHQSQSRHHQISYAPPHPSHHPVMTQSGFLGVSQMAPVSYQVPVTTVIQHRMTASEPQQRLGSSPCATSASSFYMPPHMQSTAGACASSGSGASGCSAGRLQGAQVAGAGVNPCSLTKLQQLTNGLDMLPPGHCGGAMTPSSPINLTPPPPGASHAGMNTPPVAHQVLQQNYNKLLSNLGAAPGSNAACTTSPSTPSPSAPTSASGGSSSSALSSSSSVSSNRSSSRGAANSHHHHSHHHPSVSNSSSNAAAAAAAAASSRASMSGASVINPMMRYGGGPYGYQMPGQPGASAQTLSYIANGAASFQPQIPVRMGVMNVAAAQNQYGQDPTQNAMYNAYYSNYLR